MAQIQIDNFKMAYSDTGGAGRPIVLIHGYPFNRSLWTEQIAALSGNYRVVAPDLRGFGESDSSDSVATMNRMAQDVAALLDHLKIARATIGSLSMGGYVSFAFYRQFASRVRALILADTRAQADTDEAKRTRARQAEKALADGMAGIADAMLPKLLTPETVSKRPDIVKRVRDMMLKTSSAGAAAALRGMAERDDQTPLLSKITVPTLIIVGAEDAITPVADSELMNASIAGSRLVVLENAGHVSNLERTEQFNEALLDFLKESSS